MAKKTQRTATVAMHPRHRSAKGGAVESAWMLSTKQCRSISDAGTPHHHDHRPPHRGKTGNQAVGSLLAFLALARLSVACQDAGVSAIVLQIRPRMRSGSAGALVPHTGRAAGMEAAFSKDAESFAHRSNERRCQASWAQRC